MTAGDKLILDVLIEQSKSIAVSGHIKPDGDCIGSVLALYNYLDANYPEKEAAVYLETPSGKFRFLKNFDRIDSEYPDHDPFDLMVCLDCSTKERLGKAQKYFDAAGHTICLDHHVSNTGYADENYVYGQSGSACEVLYDHLDHEKLNREIAKCLYTGIVTDTGVFKYSSTSPKTLRTAASLMEYGLPVNEIIDEAFYAKDWNENRMLGYAVMNSKMAYDGRVIYSCISRQEMQEFSVSTRELDGIVPQLKLTRGVDCAIFMYETGPYQYKVSFRTSEAVDGNRVASVFGGGGHERAAGCNVCGEADTCLEALLLEVGKVL